MPRVFIPAELRSFTQGDSIAHVPGTTIREVIASLESLYPGVSTQLMHEGRILPGLSVVVDARVSSRGLRETVQPDSEVQFLPSISGG